MKKKTIITQKNIKIKIKHTQHCPYFGSIHSLYSPLIQVLMSVARNENLGSVLFPDVTYLSLVITLSSI